MLHSRLPNHNPPQLALHFATTTTLSIVLVLCGNSRTTRRKHLGCVLKRVLLKKEHM